MSLNNENIEKFISSFEQEAKAIKEEVLRLCWFMRGSVTYDEGMLLSSTERELINKIVKDNLETTKKTQLPFF